MATKPPTLPIWATNTNYPATADPIKVEPSLGVKQAGWAPDQKPPAQWWNWFSNLVYLWTVWLDAFETEAHTWTKIQTHSDEVIFSGNGVGGFAATFGSKVAFQAGTVDFSGGTVSFFNSSPVVFQGNATFNDPSVFNDVVTFNNIGTFGVGSDPVFNAPSTFNELATFTKTITGTGGAGLIGGDFTGGTGNTIGVRGQGRGSGSGGESTGGATGHGFVGRGGTASGSGLVGIASAAGGQGVVGTGNGSGGAGAGVAGNAGGGTNGTGGYFIGDGSGPGTTTYGGVSGYGAILTATSAAPTRSALRLAPQTANPTVGLLGDIYVNSGTGFLMIYDGTAWVKVGAQ